MSLAVSDGFGSEHATADSETRVDSIDFPTWFFVDIQDMNEAFPDIPKYAWSREEHIPQTNPLVASAATAARGRHP